MSQIDFDRRGNFPTRHANEVGNSELNLGKTRELFTAIGTAVCSKMELQNDLDSVVITDYAGKIIYVSPEWETMCCYQYDEVFGHSTKLLQGTKTDFNETKNFTRNIYRTGYAKAGIVNYRKGQHAFWNVISVTKHIHEEIGTIFVGILYDYSFPLSRLVFPMRQFTSNHVCLFSAHYERDESSSDGSHEHNSSSNDGSDMSNSVGSDDSGGSETSHEGDKDSNDGDYKSKQNKIKLKVDKNKQRAAQKQMNSMIKYSAQTAHKSLKRVLSHQPLGSLSNFHPEDAKSHHTHHCCIPKFSFLPAVSCMSLACAKWDPHVLSLWVRNVAIVDGFQKFKNSNGDNLPIDDPNVFEFIMTKNMKGNYPNEESKMSSCFKQDDTLMICTNLIPTSTPQTHSILLRRVKGNTLDFLNFTHHLSLCLQDDSRHMATSITLRERDQ